MKKIFLGTILTAGLMATGSAQARTSDSLLSSLFGLGVESSINSHYDDHRYDSNYYDRRPVRQGNRTSKCEEHHHPQGKANGYWRNHDKHHVAHRSNHNDRRDWGRSDRDRHDRRNEDRHGRRDH